MSIKTKRNLSAFALLLAAQMLFVAARPAVAAEILERIIAVVNDEIITEQDLQLMMAPVVAQYRTRFTSAELEEKLKDARRDFLNKVIEDKLILSEAKRRQVIVKDIEVEDMLSEIRNKFPSREVFLKSLEDQGLTEKKLWNRFYDQLMTQKLITFEVKSRVSVSPGEVNAYYKAHPDLFAQGDRVRLQHILVRVGSRTQEEAKTFAESLAAQIRAGKPFEELAKSYSEGSEAKEGGEMGWVEKGQLLGEIDEKVFALNEGEITVPISSNLGYHIFKLAERKKSSLKPLSEVRNKIQDYIFKQKSRQRLEAWLQNLTKHAYISIR